MSGYNGESHFRCVAEGKSVGFAATVSSKKQNLHIKNLHLLRRSRYDTRYVRKYC